jgi:hypothetical protein
VISAPLRRRITVSSRALVSLFCPITSTGLLVHFFTSLTLSLPCVCPWLGPALEPAGMYGSYGSLDL